MLLRFRLHVRLLLRMIDLLPHADPTGAHGTLFALLKIKGLLEVVRNSDCAHLAHDLTVHRFLKDGDPLRAVEALLAAPHIDSTTKKY